MNRKPSIQQTAPEVVPKRLRSYCDKAGGENEGVNIRHGPRVQILGQVFLRKTSSLRGWTWHQPVL